MNEMDIFENYIMGGSRMFKCFEGNVEITGDNPPRVSVRQKEYNNLVELVEKLIKDIYDITNDKGELTKKLIAFETANKENKKLVERLDERISEKNREIEELKKGEEDQLNRIEELHNKLIKTRSEVNEANIRNKLLENSNNSLVKDKLECLEENRRLAEDYRKIHDILCKNCKYDNDVDDICFRACDCGSHFCPENPKELHKKIKCLEVEGAHLAEEYLELKGKYDKVVEEKNKEINSLNITKEFYINRAKDLATEREDFSKKWDDALCELGEKIRENDELKKQIDSVYYDILDSDTLGLPHGNYLTRSNRYPIYRHNGDNNMVTKDFTLVGYLYVKNVDDGENLAYKTIGEVKSWCIREDEIYDDNTKIVKIPRHHIAIVPMRKDGIEAAEKWVIE